MTDESIEQDIQATGLTAPRVTPADIEAEIVSEHYFTAAEGVIGNVDEEGQMPPSLDLLTFCVLALRNGHTVAGTAYCADPERFNAQTGRETARDDAIRQLWPMVIIAKRNQLANIQQT